MKGEYVKKHFYGRSRAHDPINQDIDLSGGATTLLLHRGIGVKKNCVDNAQSKILQKNWRIGKRIEHSKNEREAKRVFLFLTYSRQEEWKR